MAEDETLISAERLAAALVRAFAEAEPTPGQRLAVEAAIHEALGAMPDARPDADGFVRFVHHRASGAPLSALAIDDLLLAFAALSGVRSALAVVIAKAAQIVAHELARNSVPAAQAADAQQLFLERLAVGDASSPAKLLQYRGHGGIESWLRVSAVRFAINTTRNLGRRPSRTRPTSPSKSRRTIRSSSASTGSTAGTSSAASAPRWLRCRPNDGFCSSNTTSMVSIARASPVSTACTAPPSPAGCATPPRSCSPRPSASSCAVCTAVRTPSTASCDYLQSRLEVSVRMLFEDSHRR